MAMITILVPNKGCWDVPKNAFAKMSCQDGAVEESTQGKKNIYINLHLILNSEPAFSK